MNCAITRYASCVIETAPEKSRRIVLMSRDTKRKETFASLEALSPARHYKLPLLAHLIRVFRPSGGLTLTTDSEAPAGGGDRRRIVRHGRGYLRGAPRSHLTGAGLRRRKTGFTSAATWKPSSCVIRVPCTGTQDHYPPAFGVGGAAAVVLAPGGERREVLGCNLDELRTMTLVLCYTGKPKQHGNNNWEVFMRHINGDRRVTQNLEKIAVVARQVRAALERNQWSELGRLVREEWEFRRRNLRTISTPVIDRIISSARRHGALRRQRSVARAVAGA